MDMLWNFEGMVSIIQPERNYGSSELLEQLFIANYHFFLATTEKCSHSCQTLWRHIIKSNQLYIAVLKIASIKSDTELSIFKTFDLNG